MRIGIDVDDTLTCTSESFNRVIKKYKVNFSKKFKDNWTKEEKEFIFKNYLKETLEGARFKKYAKEVLKKLSSMGHEIIIITARNEKHCEGVEKMTRDLMNQNNINISEYYFGEFTKSDIAKKINIDLMIDDNSNVCNNMQKEGIDCILFEGKIKNWNEVFEYINKKEE